MLSTVIDPELGYSLVALGLVYDVFFDEAERFVRVTITFTSPACPASEDIIGAIKDKLVEMEEVDRVEVAVTFEPRWTAMKASDDVKAEFAIRGIPLG